MKNPRNSAILRATALGPAPNVKQEAANAWLPYGLPYLAVLELFTPRRRGCAGYAFGGLTEPEIRLALLLVAASEEWEGR